MAQAALDQAINQRSVGSLEGLGDFWRVSASSPMSRLEARGWLRCCCATDGSSRPGHCSTTLAASTRCSRATCSVWPGSSIPSSMPTCSPGSRSTSRGWSASWRGCAPSASSSRAQAPASYPRGEPWRGWPSPARACCGSPATSQPVAPGFCGCCTGWRAPAPPTLCWTR